MLVAHGLAAARIYARDANSAHAQTTFYSPHKVASYYYDDIVTNDNSCSILAVQVHHSSHLSGGFIGASAGQSKASAKALLFETVPITLKPHHGESKASLQKYFYELT